MKTSKREIDNNAEIINLRIYNPLDLDKDSPSTLGKTLVFSQINVPSDASFKPDSNLESQGDIMELEYCPSRYFSLFRVNEFNTTIYLSLIEYNLPIKADIIKNDIFKHLWAISWQRC